MADRGDLTDIERTFSEIAVALFAPGTVSGTLQRIVDLAVVSVDGCEVAGVLVADADSVLTTLAASSAVGSALDDVQVAADRGPCLSAARDGTSVYAEDLLDDDRWPEFAAAAVAADVRTVLAYALSTGRPAALNLYGRSPDAFDGSARAQAVLFATLARLALESANERARDDARASDLGEALRTRELIGQAQGILMERERITGEQAFEVLRRASQHLNIKLREVAITLVETGQDPDTGARVDPRR